MSCMPERESAGRARRIAHSGRVTTRQAQTPRVGFGLVVGVGDLESIVSDGRGEVVAVPRTDQGFAVFVGASWTSKLWLMAPSPRLPW